MRVHFLIDWPALSAAEARDPSVERYPAGSVADVSDDFGQSAVAAEAGEVTTADVTVVWKAPVVEAPAPAPIEPAVPDPAAPAVVAAPVPPAA